MAYKTAKNLLQNADTYNAYYGDFRGVDFSSEHTQVHPSRLAYAVNMYKDYRSGQGGSIETIPGFRRVINVPGGEKIHAIHKLMVKGEEHVLVHAGKHLYRWNSYPATVGVACLASFVLENGETFMNDTKQYAVSLAAHSVIGVTMGNGMELLSDLWDYKGETLTIESSELSAGDVITVSYYEDLWTADTALFSEMNERKSVSFSMGDKGYLLDGKNYLVYDGKNIAHVKDDAYVPTTRIGIIPTGEDQNEGEQHEQRNLLSPKFKQTFRSDGVHNSFFLTEEDAVVSSVKVHGVTKTLGFYTAENAVVFTETAPPSDMDKDTLYYPKGFKGLFVSYRNSYHNSEDDAFASYERTAYYLCDGVKKEYELEGNSVNGSSLTERRVKVKEVLLYGKSVDYTLDEERYVLIFSKAPERPEAVAYEKNAYPADYFGVEITGEMTLKKIDGLPSFTNSSDLITKCTMATVFDGRVFLSGNPDCPNRVFYCGRNSDDVADPSYFGEYDHFADGSDSVAIKGMVPVSDVLCVLKEGSAQEGSVYYHTPTETGENVMPKVYPLSEGIGSLGCLGACVNFIDDPVFVSREGLSAIGQLSVRYERAIEHRSSMVDAKLTNEELSSAFLTVWDNYLILFVNGKAYMADSRQRYTDGNGVVQYEWYYAEGIGVYDDQYEEYRYASTLPELPEGETLTTEKGAKIEIIGTELSYDDLDLHDMRGAVANPPGEDGNASVSIASVGKYSYVLRNEHAYLCEPTGAMTGGTFKKATCAIKLGENLFFGTENGCVCAFNFDKRNALGEIPSQYYSFDGRTILSGCATKMDNCGIPHLTKNTVKKSMVVKTKTLGRSAVKIKVRTNKNPYNQVARISSARFDFEDMDFSDFSFVPTEQSLFSIREKEKKWVEKQLYLFSDEYCKPFSLFYIAYRYTVAGRYKE